VLPGERVREALEDFEAATRAWTSSRPFTFSTREESRPYQPRAQMSTTARRLQCRIAWREMQLPKSAEMQRSHKVLPDLRMDVDCREFWVLGPARGSTAPERGRGMRMCQRVPVGPPDSKYCVSRPRLSWYVR
jgi:hypothetical protein